MQPSQDIERMICRLMKSSMMSFRSEMTVWRGHNLVPNTLRYAFAGLTVGNTVLPTFEVTRIAMGSGTTAPANTDTALETETIRGSLSDRSALNNVAYYDKFWNNSEVGGNTYKEVGLFVDGTDVADSGYLFSHVAIDESPSANETLTINATMTVS